MKPGSSTSQLFVKQQLPSQARAPSEHMYTSDKLKLAFAPQPEHFRFNSCCAVVEFGVKFFCLRMSVATTRCVLRQMITQAQLAPCTQPRSLHEVPATWYPENPASWKPILQPLVPAQEIPEGGLPAGSPPAPHLRRAHQARLGGEPAAVLAGVERGRHRGHGGPPSL